VLLPQKSNALLVAVWVIFALYVASMGSEARGRLGEAAYYLVLVPLGIFVLLCYWHMGKEGRAVEFAPIADGMQADAWYIILMRGVLYSISLAPVELLFWNRDTFAHAARTKRKIVGAICLLAAIAFLFSAAAIGILGIEGIRDAKHSVMAVAGCLQVTGAVVMQKQGLVLLFFLFSMLVATGSLIFFAVHILRQIFVEKNTMRAENSHMKRMAIWRKPFVCVGVLVWLLAMIWCEIFPEQKDTEQEALAAEAEIEDRAYCTCIAIDCGSDGKYQFTLELAMSEKDKSNIVVYEEKNLSEVAKKYDADSNKELDISHLQVLVFGEEVMQSGDYLAIIQEFGSSDLYFGSTLLVRTKMTGQEFLTSYKKENDSVGVHIRKRFEQGLKEEKAQLSDVYFDWLNSGDAKRILQKIPQI